MNLHSRIKRVEKLLAKRSRWDGARDPLSPIYHHGRVAGRSLLEVRQESLQRAIALRTKIHREHPELVPQLEVIVGNLQRGIESLQLAGVQRREDDALRETTLRIRPNPTSVCPQAESIGDRDT